MATVRVVTGINVERRFVGMVPGSALGPAICVVNPDDCCADVYGSGGGGSGGPGGGGGSGGGSGSGSVTTGCCPNPVPATLVATASLKTGACVCVPTTMTLDYVVGIGWVGSMEACGQPLPIYLKCEFGTWRFENASVASSVIVSMTCNPFVLVLDMTGSDLTCVGTWRATITE